MERRIIRNESIPDGKITIPLSTTKPSLKDFMKLTADKMKGADKQEVLNAIERLKATDVEYANASNAIEITWLEEGNEVLKDFMSEIKKRITVEGTTMSELLKGIELLSKELKLHYGLPTQIHNHRHKINRGMDDDTLNNRIEELQKILAGNTVETALV